MKFHFKLMVWEEIRVPDSPEVDLIRQRIESGELTTSTEVFDALHENLPERDIQLMRLIEFEEDAKPGEIVQRPTIEVQSDDHEVLWSNR